MAPGRRYSGKNTWRRISLICRRVRRARSTLIESGRSSSRLREAEAMAQPTKNTDAPPTEEVGTFGKVAVKLGFITQKQLEEAMRAQAAAAKAGLRKRLGEILLKKGYMSPEQLQKVLKGQTVVRKR